VVKTKILLAFTSEYKLQAARHLDPRQHISTRKKRFGAEGANDLPGCGNCGVLEEDPPPVGLRAENKRCSRSVNTKKAAAHFAMDHDARGSTDHPLSS
jgi:hypothetical protein